MYKKVKINKTEERQNRSFESRRSEEILCMWIEIIRRSNNSFFLCLLQTQQTQIMMWWLRIKWQQRRHKKKLKWNLNKNIISIKKKETYIHNEIMWKRKTKLNKLLRRIYYWIINENYMKSKTLIAQRTTKKDGSI